MQNVIENINALNVKSELLYLIINVISSYPPLTYDILLIKLNRLFKSEKRDRHFIADESSRETR